MIGLCALGVALAQSHRGPTDGFAEYSHLSFRAMRKAYPVDRPMRFEVMSRASLPDPVVVALEMLERHPAAEGLPAYTTFDRVMEDVFAEREDEPCHFVTVPPRRPFVVRWDPNAQPRHYRPVVGATYRLCLVTRGALLGGGAAFWSHPFHFKHSGSRR